MTSAVGTTSTGRDFTRSVEAGRLAPAARLAARRLRAALAVNLRIDGRDGTSRAGGTVAEALLEVALARTA